MTNGKKGEKRGWGWGWGEDECKRREEKRATFKKKKDEWMEVRKGFRNECEQLTDFLVRCQKNNNPPPLLFLVQPFLFSFPACLAGLSEQTCCDTREILWANRFRVRERNINCFSVLREKLLQNSHICSSDSTVHVPPWGFRHRLVPTSGRCVSRGPWRS